MSGPTGDTGHPGKGWSRRKVLERGALAGLMGGMLAAGSALAQKVADKIGGPTAPDPRSHSLEGAFQEHYQRMSPAEVKEAIGRIQREAKRRYGVDLNVETTPPQENVVFGYALNISKCKGVRKCVEACVKENNTSRDSQIQFIRVLEMDSGGLNLHQANQYYDAEEVPRQGKFYLPMQCMQCDNPPCVKACPVEATWAEPDGMVVVDYEWCIGCRYCMAACPYWARRFNWMDPTLPTEEITTDTHYLGNRPRRRGVVEKCTVCIQRTRKGRLPACLEACPTGARIFGNLLDPDSDIRYVLENKTVFRLKEDLGTQPKFWYFTD